MTVAPTTGTTGGVQGTALPVERGCGRRVRGGLYWECGLGPHGTPVEEFLLDPPVPPPTGLGLRARGVTPLVVDGVTHLLDWVGADSYPNTADFVEEVRRCGLSRRLPVTLDLSALSPASRLLLVHARARVVNAGEYGPFPCPTDRHVPGTDGCVGVWWEDVEGGEPCGGDNPRAVIRRLPSLAYAAWRRPHGVTPEYTAALFASFPAARLVVVAGGNGRAEAAAGRAVLPMAVVEA